MGEEMQEVAARAVEEASRQIEELSMHPELPWFRHVAFSSTVIAVLCAISTYFSGAASDKAALEATREIVYWQALQTARAEQSVFDARNEILLALGHQAPNREIRHRIVQEEEYDAAVFAAARVNTAELYDAHDVMEGGLTLFQLSLALGAIALLVRRRSLWFVGLSFSAVAVACTIAGYLRFEHLVAQRADQAIPQYDEVTDAR